jgi:hypothetical protein
MPGDLQAHCTALRCVGLSSRDDVAACRFDAGVHAAVRASHARVRSTLNRRRYRAETQRGSGDLVTMR